MKVMILGATGMLGHMLAIKLASMFNIVACARTFGMTPRLAKFRVTLPKIVTMCEGIDVTQPQTIRVLLEQHEPDVVCNCIGLVKQRSEALVPVDAIAINALWPHQLADLCKHVGARLIHFSTDCVFSGRHGPYREDTLPDPDDLYGRSKLLGELHEPHCLTLRSSIIGPELVRGLGLFEWFRHQQGRTVSGFTQAVYSGLTTTAMSQIVARVVADFPSMAGVWQVASKPIAKADLLAALREEFRWNIGIEPCAEPRCERSLDGSRFAAATGIEIAPWPEMIRALREHCQSYAELYSGSA